MAPAATRVEPVAGDFLESVPHSGNAYLLKFVLHDWDDQRAARILRNCRDAMLPDGRVFVIEVLVPSDARPSVAKTHDLNMLVLTGGRERTLDEYRRLFRAAGLEFVQTMLTESGISILEGRINLPVPQGRTAERMSLLFVRWRPERLLRLEGRGLR